MSFLSGALFVFNLAWAVHFALKRQAFIAWFCVAGAMGALLSEAIRWLA